MKRVVKEKEMPRDKERELEDLFEHFAKLVEKERKRRVKKDTDKQDTQKKDGRYIKHDRG